MKTKAKILIFISLLLAILAFIYLKYQQPKTQQLTLPNGTTINIEVVDNPASRAKGLMYREHMDENAGMLFVFDTKFKYVFWMKNTFIPLDMIWLDENMKIVDITYNALPCKPNEKCKTYMPSQQALYVLEVNAGVSEKNGLKIGDQITKDF